jgi:hypothetical protein
MQVKPGTGRSSDSKRNRISSIQGSSPLITSRRVDEGKTPLFMVKTVVSLPFTFFIAFTVHAWLARLWHREKAISRTQRMLRVASLRVVVDLFPRIENTAQS